MRIALVLLAACNQVYGLEETKVSADALIPCPAPGALPQFLRNFTQVVVEPCSWYTEHPGVGVGVGQCRNAAGQQTIAMRQIADPSGHMTTLDLGPSIANPRMSPEGELFVHYYTLDTEILRFTFDGQTWIKDPSYSLKNLGFLAQMGTPTRAPRRWMYLRPAFPVDDIVEIDDTGARIGLPYLPAELFPFATVLSPLDLSPDGLVLVFGASESTGVNNGIYYASRASLNDRFGVAQRIPTLPYGDDPYFTPDCSRMYFSALDSVYYAPAH